MMNRKQYVLMMVLAITSGFVGGVMSNWLLMGEPVFAQNASQPAKVIRAQRFELVNEQGKIAGILGVTKELQIPLFELYDAKGKRRIVMEVSPTTEEGNNLIFYDIKGVPRLTLFGGNGPAIVLSTDKYQTSEQGLRGLKVGPDFLSFFSDTKSNNVNQLQSDLISMSINYLGEPQMVFRDKNGKSRIVLGGSDILSKTDPNWRPITSLGLFEGDGKVLWSMPTLNPGD